jgi:DNA-binding NtrC family response regulator
MNRLLVIDDDRTVHHLVRKMLEPLGFEVLSAYSADEGLEEIEKQNPDAVLLDVILPDKSGLEAFEVIAERDSRLPVIVITGSGSSDTAIQAMKLGAFDYITKPMNVVRLQDLVKSALESRRFSSVPVGLQGMLEPDEKGDAFIGRCSAMQDVFKAIGRVASQNVTVLVRGESGTGKELVARAIYQYSARSSKPLAFSPPCRFHFFQYGKCRLAPVRRGDDAGQRRFGHLSPGYPGYRGKNPHQRHDDRERGQGIADKAGQ